MAQSNLRKLHQDVFMPGDLCWFGPGVVRVTEVVGEGPSYRGARSVRVRRRGISAWVNPGSLQPVRPGDGHDQYRSDYEEAPVADALEPDELDD